MADEPTISAVAPAGGAPASAEPVAAPAAPVAPAPAAPAAEPTPAVAEQSADPKPAEPVAAETPTEEKPAEAKADDAKPADGADPKPADAPAEPAVEAPKAFEFKLPETIKADAATLSAYNNVLGKYGISQEAGQELIDFHANAIKATSDQMNQHQQDVWAKTNQDWIADFDKSAGNQRDTILNDAKFAISDTIKDAKARKEVWDVLSFTGAGNNRHVINALAKIGKRLRERGAPNVTGAPVNGARQGSAADRRYGGTNTPKA